MIADVGFTVAAADYARDLDALRAVREAVFVREQQVPLALEWDALDPQCVHVIARDDRGRPIGTGRLTPQRSIGRMAVARDWRGRGVGDALLLALLQQARQSGWHEVTLNAQVSAIGFYIRHGFLPFDARFMEAGIEHQAMRFAFDGIVAINEHDAAVAIVIALTAAARRTLRIYSRDLDPGLLDAPAALEALRRFGTAGRGNEVCILLQDAATPQRAHAPVLALAQRLPSVFAFREVVDPADRACPSAFVVNDVDGYYFRGLGHRFHGEAELHAPGRGRQLREGFDRVWERARVVGEYRSLAL